MDVSVSAAASAAEGRSAERGLPDPACAGRGERMGDVTPAETANPTVKGPAPRQAAFELISASALMNSISFGIMLPIVPKSDPGTGGRRHVLGLGMERALRDQLGGDAALLWPAVGHAVDRVGRRPVLLISFFGLGLDFLLMAYAPNLWWLLVGRLLQWGDGQHDVDRQRLPRRRHPTRKTRKDLWPDGICVLHRLHRRTDARRSAWRA